jgi:hypothetical protein
MYLVGTIHLVFYSDYNVFILFRHLLKEVLNVQGALHSQRLAGYLGLRPNAGQSWRRMFSFRFFFNALGIVESTLVIVHQGVCLFGQLGIDPLVYGQMGRRTSVYYSVSSVAHQFWCVWTTYHCSCLPCLLGLATVLGRS